MRLRSPDGVSVELRITGYEFPDYIVSATEMAVRRLRAVTIAPQLPDPDVKDIDWLDWDANWLQVRGNIILADGKTWAFEHPCLTTWQARDLGIWLRGAAAGTVLPPPVVDGVPEAQLEFLEPNIGFSVEERTVDRVQIRVHLSLEALPPWLQGAEEQPGLYEYFVRLDVSAEELTQAVESWMLELAEFPER